MKEADMATYLKWMTRLLMVLTTGCAVMALASFYHLRVGGCAGGGPECGQAAAVMYMFLVGVFGFGISAFAGYMISKNLEEDR